MRIFTRVQVHTRTPDTVMSWHRDIMILYSWVYFGHVTFAAILNFSWPCGLPPSWISDHLVFRHLEISSIFSDFIVPPTFQWKSNFQYSKTKIRTRKLSRPGFETSPLDFEIQYVKTIPKRIIPYKAKFILLCPIFSLLLRIFFILELWIIFYFLNI